MAQQIDLSGNDIVVGNIYSGASTPGAAGTIVASSDLSGITPGTVTASKAVVVDSSKNIATLGTVGCGTITITDASNVVLGTTTGTKIGTGATQKLGFYNATPVVLPATTGTTTGFTAATGTAVLAGSTFTGNTGSTAYTIGDVVLALKSLGLLTA